MDLPEKGKAAWRKGMKKWCKSHVDTLARSKAGMKRIFDVEEVNLLTCISSLSLLNLRNHVAAAAAACAAFKLPTTANAMTGETEYEICTRKSAYHVFAAPTDGPYLRSITLQSPTFLPHQRHSRLRAQSTSRLEGPLASTSDRTTIADRPKPKRCAWRADI